MGMSASQARLLSLTARKNDIELKSQQISNAKLRLNSESEKVSQNYLDALNKTKLAKTCWNAASGTTSFQDLNLASLALLGYKLVKKPAANDEQAITVTDPTNVAYVNEPVMKTALSAGDLSSMIASGEYYLADINTGEQVNLSTCTSINEVSDDTDLAVAEAEYEAETKKLNSKEKKLDTEMKSLDTEHSAIQTEADTIKNVISKNVESGFSIFS